MVEDEHPLIVLFHVAYIHELIKIVGSEVHADCELPFQEIGLITLPENILSETGSALECVGSIADIICGLIILFYNLQFRFIKFQSNDRVMLSFNLQRYTYPA